MSYVLSLLYRPFSSTYDMVFVKYKLFFLRTGKSIHRTNLFKAIATLIVVPFVYYHVSVWLIGLFGFPYAFNRFIARLLAAAATTPLIPLVLYDMLQK